MPFSDYGKNKMLDNLDESVAGGALYASLHTAYSTTGTNEVTGGTPAYARKAVTWAAAAAGSKATSAAVTFDVPATTVAFVGFWDAVSAGNFVGMTPATAGPLKMAVADAGGVTADELDSPAHGYANGDTVVPWQISGAGIPTGLTAGTIYYVVGVTTDTFQLSATSGGSAINITAVGKCFVQKIVVEVFAAQGTYQLSSGTLDLTTV